MSLTILFQTPVDTGRANISTDVKNANLWKFYLITGNSDPGYIPIATGLQRPIQGQVIL